VPIRSSPCVRPICCEPVDSTHPDTQGDEDRVLIRLCDGLQQSSTVDDDVWADLKVHHSDEAILEVLMLAGTYRTVSYLVNGLRLPLEPGAGRFPA